MKKIDEARKNLAHLDAYTQCVQLASKFTILQHQGKMYELIELWADREDTCFRAVWGTYKGYAGIRRCFLKDFGDIQDPDYAESYKGLIDLQSLSSEYVVVDDDNQTARASFKGLGVFVPGKVALDEEDKGRHFWTMANYGFDFINENGTWKLWHVLMAPTFFNNFEVRWGREGSKPFTQFPLRPTTEDCPTYEKIYNYSFDEVYYQFPVPGKYPHWESVAPGYGIAE